MTEEQQDQAALYALGSLPADEAAEFEREMAGDPELQSLARDLQEAVASLARTDTAPPPADLKRRVLAAVTAETRPEQPTAGKVVRGPWSGWLPWSMAAALALCCGALAWDDAGRRDDLVSARDLLRTEQSLRLASTPEPRTNAFRNVVYCSLQPVPAPPENAPQVAVLWDATLRRGRLRVSHLPAAGEGKDYQLWTVQTGQKDAVSAGVIKPAVGDATEVDFQPDATGGPGAVVAFALSVERAGGAPKNEGPILFLGKL